MRTVSAISLCLGLALMLSLVYRTAAACQVDEFYLTNGGYLASPAPDNLLKAEKADGQRLEGMLTRGEVIRLKDGVRVQAKEWSFEYDMIRIRLLDSDVPVWVRQGALRRVEQ
jgi:hypothetical protein